MWRLENHSCERRWSFVANVKRSKYLVLAVFSACFISPSESLSNAFLEKQLRLSDLPTPSVVIDLKALKNCCVSESTFEALDKNQTVALSLSKSKIVLFPVKDDSVDYDALEFRVRSADDESSTNPSGNNKEVGVYTFVHSSVVRAKEDAVEFRDNLNRFLAEIDVSRSMVGPKGARLCLGLNNHHVGGYYWARSAGSGAAMDAPGVVYDETDFYQDGDGDNKGILMWENDVSTSSTSEGSVEELGNFSLVSCNSNDGKRSEWVNFLRKGDMVQIVPADVEDCILEFIRKFDYYGEQKSIRVFGISNEGQPLGSEPSVKCEWRCG